MGRVAVLERDGSVKGRLAAWAFTHDRESFGGHSAGGRKVPGGGNAGDSLEHAGRGGRAEAGSSRCGPSGGERIVCFYWLIPILC